MSDRTKTDPEPPGYLEALAKLAGKPGEVVHVTVRHEDRCRIWQTGVCTCVSEVVPGEPGHE